MASVNFFPRFIADDGDVIIPDTGNVLAEVQQEWRDVFGNALSLEESTPQGRIIEMETASRKQVLEVYAQIANQLNYTYANGKFLDSIASLFAIKRRPATATRCSCTFTGTPNTLIPVGSLAKDANGNMFATEHDVVLEANGTKNGDMVCQTLGAIAVGVGELNAIVSVVDGWKSVTNDVTTIGTNEESDASLRKRIGACRYSGVGAVADVASAIKAVPNVNSSVVINNGTGEDMGFPDDDITIPAHSICIITDGGNQNDIARAIYKTVSCGCGYCALEDQSNTVYYDETTGGYTVRYSVTYNIAEPVEIVVALTIRRNHYTRTDAELIAEVLTAITNWEYSGTPSVDKLEIGTAVSPFEIATAINEQCNPIIVNSCAVKRKSSSGDPSVQNIYIKKREIAVIKQSDVTINIID